MATTLVISEVFPPKTGGSGRWFWELYRRLPRGEYVIAAGEDPRQDEFDRTHDLRIRRIPLSVRQWGLRSREGLAGYARAIRRLGSIMRRERVECIHVGRCLPEGLLALAFKLFAGTPYICYAHGEELTCAGSSRELRWLMRRVFSGAGRVICNSRNTWKLLRSSWGLPESRLAILHPGVDTQWFVPVERDARVRAELGWGDRPVILTVGRLQKRKGHDMMIRALGQIRATVPEVQYAIVGDGEERAALEQLAVTEGVADQVRFHGEADEATLLRCYQQCELFVLPNRQVGEDIEGFGMVLVEAQACGKPVIAGDSGGTAETMRVGETGEVVDCRGPDQLAELVTGFLSEPARRGKMGRAARAWTLQEFDWTKLSQKAESLFRRSRSSKRHHVLATHRTVSMLANA
jgi:phosphatidylinositol alpha-1,6-mannosyltransferase